MAHNIYFITEARIKSMSTILGNVDSQLIAPLVPTLAAQWIEPVLGSYFYDHLLTVYNAETASPGEEVLISLIQNSLLWRVASDVTITSSSQLTNKGPQDQNGINSTASDLTKVGLLSRHYTNKAEFFQERVAAHIKLNKDSYPKFTAPENNNSSLVDIKPSTTSAHNNDIIFF